jgi:transcriptional regulator
MYLREQFSETRIEVLHGLVRARPLATFVTIVDGALAVDHMPCHLHPESGLGVLRAHMPRTNAVASALGSGAQAVAIFHGPQTYVSPSWYPSKKEDGRVVPTWNYVVVHARGRPRVVDDTAWLLDHLGALTDEHEARRSEPWRITDAPREFIERMAASLVGIEMPISSLVGKWKVSQNRPLADRLGAAEGLRALGDECSLEMAEAIEAATRSTDRA